MVPKGTEETPVAVSTTDSESDFSESGDLTGDGGVIKEIIAHGENGWQKPESGDEIQMHYRGTLLDGTEFDSSYSRGTPFNFKLGEGNVIKGWDIVGKSMAKNEKSKVTLKPEYAYGENGSPPKIPANATLVFEMELISWVSKRDVFGDGLCFKTEVNAGEGWERPGKLAEVTVDVTAIALESDAKTETNKLFSGETTFTIGSNHAPESWEKVVPDMKKDALLHLVCRPPHTSGPGITYVPEGTPAVRFELKLKSWRKIEDIHSDGTLVKKMLAEGEGWERPGEGSEATVTIKYFIPQAGSTLSVPPPAGEVLLAQENISFKVGDGVVIDGVDRVVQSMKLNEHALVCIAPKHAFETAPTLLTEEMRGKGLTNSSVLLLDITVTKFEKSKDVWSMSVEEKIEEMRARKERGNQLFKDGRHSSAKKCYDRAVSYFDSPTSDLSPEVKAQVNELLVQCHLNLAMCLERMDDIQKVLTHCKKALEIQPANVKALYRQGCAYLAIDDYDNAGSSLRYARDRSPGNANVVRKLKELKTKRLKQDAQDKKLFSNLFGRMSKMEKKEDAKKHPNGNVEEASVGVNGEGDKDVTDVDMKESEPVGAEDN